MRALPKWLPMQHDVCNMCVDISQCIAMQLSAVFLLTALSASPICMCLLLLAVIQIFQQYLKEVRISTIMFWTSIISVPLGFTQLMLISHFNRQVSVSIEMLQRSNYQQLMSSSCLAQAVIHADAALQGARHLLPGYC